MEKGKENGECEERSTFELSPLFFVCDALVALVVVGKKRFLKPKKSKIPIVTKRHLSTG